MDPSTVDQTAKGELCTGCAQLLLHQFLNVANRLSDSALRGSLKLDVDGRCYTSVKLQM